MSELRERMSNAMCLRGMAARTQEAYIGALVRVLRDQRRDFVAASVDRQVVGKLRFWQARPARCACSASRLLPKTCRRSRAIDRKRR